MSGAFSITAPRITLQQMQEEWDLFSRNQQQRALRDLNGGFSTPNTDQDRHEKLRSSLCKLENELTTIRHKPALSQALSKCPDIVKNENFRLQFLWAENFNEKLAASRLVRYWEEKVALFGKKKAFGEITLKDLEEEDQTTLDKGGLRVLPEKDNAKRAILLSCRSKWAKDRTSMARALWYLVQQALQDEQVQKNGAVLLFDDRVPDALCTPVTFDTKRDKILLRCLRDILPIRVVGIHHLFPNVDTYRDIIFPQFLSIIGPSWRARYRHYCGESITGFLTKLKNFGISQKCLSHHFLGVEAASTTATRRVKVTSIDEDSSQDGSESQPASGSLSEDAKGNKKDSKDDQDAKPDRSRQLERNKLAARARRKRQREQIENLQVSIADMTKKNKTLHDNNESLRAQATQLQIAIGTQIDNPLVSPHTRLATQSLFPALAQEAAQRQRQNLHLLNLQQALRQLHGTTAAIAPARVFNQNSGYLLEDPNPSLSGNLRDPNKS